MARQDLPTLLLSPPRVALHLHPGTVWLPC
jgi:hypothetical protein